jgi:arylsulfatase
MDPFERADITSNTYYEWTLEHGFMLLAAQVIVTEFVKSFKEFPPRQKPGSFTIDDALAAMAAAGTGGKAAMAAKA